MLLLTRLCMGFTILQPMQLGRRGIASLTNEMLFVLRCQHVLDSSILQQYRCMNTKGQMCKTSLEGWGD